MGVTITIGGTDRTALIPFVDGKSESSSITIEDTVPGIAFATLRIWDATSAISIADLATIAIFDTTNSKNIFQGFVDNRRFVPSGGVGRWIVLSCKDLNAILDTTLVGVPDGTTWTWDRVTDQYVTTDEFAQVTSGTDASNVQALIAHYWTYPVSLDTTTFVTTVNPAVGSPPTYWDRVTLRQALDDLADISSAQTIYWIDPDAKVHWSNAPVLGAPTGGAPGTTGNVTILFPQITVGSPAIPPAPYVLTDTNPNGTTSIGFENMEREDDFGGYAISLYANGATGYTYTPGTSSLPAEVGVTSYGYYVATLSQATLAYSRHPDGTIAQPGVLTGGVGQQYYVNPIFVVPSSSGGGHFWEIKNGTAGVPPNGWLLRQGDPYVTAVPQLPVVTTASVGVGGSGWVSGGGPSYFSRFIDLPTSASQMLRDTLGTSALNFSQRYLTRANCEVTGPAILFRAGMGMYVTSTQCGFANAFYPIQKVTTTFYSGTDMRHAGLEFGDAPLGSLGLRRLSAMRPVPKRPAVYHLLKVSNVQPKAGGTVSVTAQLSNDSGEGWSVAGKAVDWTVIVTDQAGSDVTATTVYSFDPDSSVTDAKGQASTKLTVSSTAGLTYTVVASSPD